MRPTKTGIGTGRRGPRANSRGTNATVNDGGRRAAPITHWGLIRTMTQEQPTASTLGELKAAGYRPLTVREEMRKNLIGAMESGEPLFPGILGYEETVLPQIENALLSGHDMIFLGERGQGKTRIIRALVRPAGSVHPGDQGQRGA